MIRTVEITRPVSRSGSSSTVCRRSSARTSSRSVVPPATISSEEFTATVVAERAPGLHAPDGITAVAVEVAGHAFRTGSSSFTFEDDDPLRHGFLLH